MRGEYHNTLDEKGRIMIPPKLRDQLGSADVVLTKSIDDCIWLYTETGFDELENAICGGPLAALNEDSRRLERAIISPARNVSFDKTGRITIPIELREYAELEKGECVILGTRQCIEIWSLIKFKEYMEGGSKPLKEAAKALSKGVK